MTLVVSTTFNISWWTPERDRDQLLPADRPLDLRPKASRPPTQGVTAPSQSGDTILYPSGAKNSEHNNLDGVPSQFIDSALGGTNDIVRISASLSYLAAITLSACQESNEATVLMQRQGFGLGLD